jgi:predicted nucleotidyltransferase
MMRHKAQAGGQKRLLAAKHRALEEFLRRLEAQPVWDCVVKVVLYGSVLRGEAREESDIDVLIVAAGNLRDVEEVASDVAFTVMLEMDQRVEPLVYCLDDYYSARPFLTAVRQQGKEIYSMTPDDMARRQAEGRPQEPGSGGRA